jgi:hypothetical protein
MADVMRQVAHRRHWLWCNQPGLNAFHVLNYCNCAGEQSNRRLITTPLKLKIKKPYARVPIGIVPHVYYHPSVFAWLWWSKQPTIPGLFLQVDRKGHETDARVPT